MPDTFVVQIDDRTTAQVPQEARRGLGSRESILGSARPSINLAGRGAGQSTPTSPRGEGVLRAASGDSLRLLASNTGALRNLGPLVNRAVAGLGKLGPAGLAAVGALAGLTLGAVAVVGSFRSLNKQVSGLTERLAQVPGPILFSRLEEDLRDFGQTLRQSSQFGEALAENARQVRRQQRSGRDISAVLTGSFTPLLTELNRAIANLLEGITPLATLTADTVETLLTPITEILRQINEASDFVIDSNDAIAAAVGTISPLLQQLLQQGKERQDAEGLDDLLRELFDFISPNNPNLRDAQGQPLPLEFNLDI